MKHIKLIENSKAINNISFKELYLSQFANLEKALSFFDRKGIEATVTFRGALTSEGLKTSVSVDCPDDVFKLVIEAGVNKFNS